MWNSLGAAPQPTEIEVTVLGPGYGESVVVHLGQGEWLIVDSCIDTVDPNRPIAPLHYLRKIGVSVDKAVKYIIVSHWDDDHVRGIDDIVEACPSARFVCSKAFPNDKFINFVEAISIGSAAAEGGNVRNIRRVLEILESRGQTIRVAGPARMLCTNPDIQSWSPSDLDEAEFLRYVAQMYPKAGKPLRKALPGTANLTSVVLTIDWPESSVLLGADMEFNSNNLRGWGAVASEVNHLKRQRKGDLVKIPHHGSHTGHDNRMWQCLLHPKPISVVTPFGKGPRQGRPPKPTDVNRIRDHSGTMFLTAKHAEQKVPKMDVAVTRSLREGMISMTSQKSPMGIVRHRRMQGDQWKHELFGAAVRVK